MRSIKGGTDWLSLFICIYETYRDLLREKVRKHANR